MLTVRSGPVVGLAAVVALLGALGATVGLNGLGWVVGVTCGVVGGCAIALGLVRSDNRALGPADHVTLGRGVLACGVAAMVADAFLGAAPVAVLVALAAAALALDAVDGWVARRTRTSSTFGARFDGEVDAFVILVLSVFVARSLGAWVLAIGAARYLFALAGWGTPWELPARPWRKVVAGVQGVVLAVAATGLLPRPLVVVALLVAMALLAESFGRDLWWLWRLRRAGLTGEDSARPAEARRHRVWSPVVDVLAVLVVWFALVAPVQPDGLAPGALLQLPLEGLAVGALALVLPSWGRRVLAAVAGTLLALLTLLKSLDVGFFAAFDRPFDLVTDRGYLGPAVEFVRDALGPLVGTAVLVAVVCLVLAVLVGVPLAVGRLTTVVTRHRRTSVRVVAALALVWAGLAVSGLHVGPGEPAASVSASRAALDHVSAVAAGIRDEQRFEAAVTVDDFSDTSGRELLAGLRGKDVLLTFVESYGRSAVEGLPSSRRLRDVLDAGTRRLGAAGYSARSGYLTSPTFGGFSWLAHATMQSGLWVDNEQRHDRLLSSERTTLTRAFNRAGWRTLAFMPSNKTGWPEGRRFYRFDEMYERDDIDYHGPRFGWSTMPDQFALRALHRLALADRDRAPVMAEVDLTSSHPPWSPLPRMVAWSRLGDGSVFRAIHERSPSPEELWQHPEDVPRAYVDSVIYSMSAVVSFVRRYGDEDLVVIVLGDHQPAAVVTGNGASRDVPISVISRDPAVIDRISGWGWQQGLRPGPQAPVWRMDAFRDRFLDTFGVAPNSDAPLAADRRAGERGAG